MNKAKPFKICHCGYTFVTELEMYQRSMPAGLQKTDEKSHFDLELRLCQKCKTTFAIKIAKVIFRPEKFGFRG